MKTQLLLYLQLTVIALAISLKLFILFSDNYHAPTRASVKAFTGFRFIDRWMFVWPMLAILSLQFIVPFFSFVERTQEVNTQLKQRLWSKWTLAYVLF